jgi:CheY-like chemotaxis protein
MGRGVPAAETILVVEDNAITREGLAAILANVGYAVTAAENGQRALELLREGLAPDLVLLDMLMPVLDGWHFIHQLHQSPGLAEVPVVVVTGTILTREWAESNGCAGFVHKPIEPGPLLEEVRHCLAS